jgi:hypothetical protein
VFTSRAGGVWAAAAYILWFLLCRQVKNHNIDAIIASIAIPPTTLPAMRPAWSCPLALLLLLGVEAVVVGVVVMPLVEDGRKVDSEVDVEAGFVLYTTPPMSHTPFPAEQHGGPSTSSPQQRLPSAQAVILTSVVFIS